MRSLGRNSVLEAVWFVFLRRKKFRRLRGSSYKEKKKHKHRRFETIPESISRLFTWRRGPMWLPWVLFRWVGWPEKDSNFWGRECNMPRARQGRRPAARRAPLGQSFFSPHLRPSFGPFRVHPMMQHDQETGPHALRVIIQAKQWFEFPLDGKQVATFRARESRGEWGVVIVSSSSKAKQNHGLSLFSRSLSLSLSLSLSRFMFFRTLIWCRRMALITKSNSKDMFFYYFLLSLLVEQAFLWEAKKKQHKLLHFFVVAISEPNDFNHLHIKTLELNNSKEKTWKKRARESSALLETFGGKFFLWKIEGKKKTRTNQQELYRFPSLLLPTQRSAREFPFTIVLSCARSLCMLSILFVASFR